MFVVIDNKPELNSYFYERFVKEGFAVDNLTVQDFESWIQYANEEDVSSIEAFFLCDTQYAQRIPAKIRTRSNAPLLALLKNSNLQETLDLFQYGVDDVLKAPIEVKEIIARVSAISRRNREGLRSKEPVFSAGTIEVFNDGRDPKINGEDFILPRRERRILEHLVANKNARVTKTQLFNTIYGLFETEVEENVIESHISKLRKKLKQKLGYDIIDSKRFLGYKLKFPK